MELSQIRSREDAGMYITARGPEESRRNRIAFLQAYELSRLGTTRRLPRISLEDLGIDSDFPQRSGNASWYELTTHSPEMLAERETLFAQVFTKLHTTPSLT
jgi:hypothetical protein